MEITTTRKDKLLDHYDDAIFKREWLENFKDKVVITIIPLEFE
jgi:hypothetical protein